MSDTTNKISPKLGKYLFFLVVIGIIIFITYYAINNKNKKDKKKTDIPDPKNPGTKPPKLAPKSPTFKYNESVINALPDGKYPIVKGQKSKLVFLLQYALNVLNNDNLKLDGNFGSNTAASVDMQFGSNFVTKEQADLLLQYVSLSPDIDPYLVFLYHSLNIS